MDSFAGIIIDAGLKSLAVLLLTAGAALVLRRASAAQRHLVWALGLAGALALPGLALVLPAWRVLPAAGTATVVPAEPVRVAAPDSAGATSRVEPQPTVDGWSVWLEPWGVGDTGAREAINPHPSPAPEREREPEVRTASTGSPAWRGLVRWWPVAYAIGVVVALLPVAVSALSLGRLRRGATVVSAGPVWAELERCRRELGLERRRVVLLRTPLRAMPMTWGALAGSVPGVPAVVLLPEEAFEGEEAQTEDPHRERCGLPRAGAWAGERVRAVLLHELAHVKRFDVATGLLAHVACAVYWWNPLVWLAARRMTVERERACDDRVLSARGAEPAMAPSAYAEHLLRVATGLESVLLTRCTAVAMARPGRPGALEDRLRAILDDGRSRRRVTLGALGAAVLLMLSVVLPVAMLRAAEETPAPSQVGPAQEQWVEGKVDKEAIVAAVRAADRLKSVEVEYEAIQEVDEAIHLVRDRRVEGRQRVDGERLYWDVTLHDGRLVMGLPVRLITTFDGERMMHWTPNERKADIIERYAPAWPTPLDLILFRDQDLAEALAKAELEWVRRENGLIGIFGRFRDEFDRESVRELWFAPERGWGIVRAAIQNGADHRYEIDAEWGEVAGGWFPIRGQSRLIKNSVATGKWVTHDTRTYVVKRVVVNPALDVSAFRSKLPAGTAVADLLTGQRYVVEAEEGEPREPASTQALAAASRDGAALSARAVRVGGDGERSGEWVTLERRQGDIAEFWWRMEPGEVRGWAHRVAELTGGEMGPYVGSSGRWPGAGEPFEVGLRLTVAGETVKVTQVERTSGPTPGRRGLPGETTMSGEEAWPAGATLRVRALADGPREIGVARWQALCELEWVRDGAVVKREALLVRLIEGEAENGNGRDVPVAGIEGE